MNQDPIGLAEGINFYSYANGNPLMNFDSYGLKAESDGNPWEFPPSRWSLPHKCETETECWEKAKENILKCRVNRACQSYWRWYQTYCPGKMPAASCSSVTSTCNNTHYNLA
ncbi:hypothetical protein [Halopseudomonas salegens]|uniref:hypothetical protein n=1 Tax=Halopseudomonas salegens TaxID=1434072 RepID=UPI001E5D7D75|nr:hypothetical protein [Halopseudomonas salegens]